LVSDKDTEILRLILDVGDINGGFRLLLTTYKERVYWQIRRLVWSHEDANDICQEVFIKVFKHLHQFKGESALFSWICSISIREAISFLRKKRLRFQELDVSNVHIIHIQEERDGFSGDEIQLKLWTAIESLPEKQKLVFKLKYFEEMPYAEMSKLLDTSEGALKASYHHAVKKIENYIINHGAEPI
jgi:RNA polymerase sigma-70 factor (ECF subfamily)